MARPVILANGNGHLLVEVERNDQALGEDVHNVVVAIGVIVEVDAKCVLPFLRLQHMASMGVMKDEVFKVQITYVLVLGSNFEVGIEVVSDAFLTFAEAHLGIKVWPYFS